MRKALLMLFVSFCIINFNADKKLTADVYHSYLNSEIDSANVSMLNSENNILLGLNNYTNNFNLYEYNNASFYDFIIIYIIIMLIIIMLKVSMI